MDRATALEMYTGAGAISPASGREGNHRGASTATSPSFPPTTSPSPTTPSPTSKLSSRSPVAASSTPRTSTRDRTRSSRPLRPRMEPGRALRWIPEHALRGASGERVRGGLGRRRRAACMAGTAGRGRAPAFSRPARGPLNMDFLIAFVAGTGGSALRTSEGWRPGSAGDCSLRPARHVGEPDSAHGSAVSIRGVLRSSVVSLGAGILMGAVSWAIHVQSPAPGPIALVGLLGIVAGQ